jgi:hypothetical protein
MSNKIIRTICVFTDSPSRETIQRLERLKQKFEGAGFGVQTVRIATNKTDFTQVRRDINDDEVRLSIGSLTLEAAEALLPALHTSHNVNFNIELAQTEITERHVDLLFQIIKGNAANTFNFTYLFNSVPTPYFPSAIYRENGFAVGLQPTDLAADCNSLQEWLDALKTVWQEIADLMTDESDFLGIDSSIAPLFEGQSSLVNFIKRLGMSFPASVTTDTYTTITQWIKSQNPNPYGLCGLMMPCLEDFELADEYEKGEFTIERNIFLSLHSGLGIDTYPMGVDESPTRILEILKLLQALSNKYGKPVSARFVSDGRAKIGERTDFKNEYLKDVVVRVL